MNVNNHSAFIQDRWAISNRLTANLGLRFEQVKVESTGEIVSVNTNPRIVPRLGASYNLTGGGGGLYAIGCEVHLTGNTFDGNEGLAEGEVHDVEFIVAPPGLRARSPRTRSPSSATTRT